MVMLAKPMDLPELVVVFRWGRLKDGTVVLMCFWTSASWPTKSYRDRFLDWGFRSYSARPRESIPTDRDGENV